MMNRNFEIYKYAVGGMLPTQEDLVFQGANIDFADYIAPNITGIGTDAAFAQKTANDRLDALLKQRQTIIDEIKLDKRYATQQGQLRGQLESLIDQAAQSQLSDNANFTKFNTGLMKIKNDEVIQKALKSTENAKAYADWRTKNPNALSKAYLNGGNEDNFQRWQNGETDEFVMRPTYVEPKWQEKIFDGIKNLPQEEKEVFKTQGSAIFQEKTKGLSEQRALNSAKSIVNYLLTSDPETAPHFQRMMQFGYDPMSDIQNTVKAAIDQYKNESVTLSNMQRNPQDVSAADWTRISIARDNADTAKLNAKLRAAEEGGTGVKFEPLIGVGEEDDQLNITKGNIKYNEGWKKSIVKTLKESNPKKYKFITDQDIILVGADKNTGKVQYKYKSGVAGMDATQTYQVPSKELQAIITAETPVQSPVITQEEFNNKWKTLEPGQSLTGPDGTTYTKVKK